MRTYISGSVMTPDENCGNGEAYKAIPTAGDTEHIVCPAGDNGAAFSVVPPDNWNGNVYADAYLKCSAEEGGTAGVFVCAEVVKTGQQYRMPENAEKAIAAATFTGAQSFEHRKASLGLVDVNGNPWVAGELLTFWVGRSSNSKSSA
jgi:hypothetical protein